MNTPSGESLTLWMNQVPPLRREPLNENISVDVCVVGAGIAGLTSAYLLLKAGRSVAVLESATIGSGQSGRTTAHFVTALDDRYFNLEKYHGLEGARLAAESHSAAIDQVEEIIQTENIDCDWRRLSGYLYLSPYEDLSLLEKEYDAVLRTGAMSIQWLDRAPLATFDTGKCLHFPRQACFHPMKYLAGLTRAIEAMGGKIYTETHADKIEGGKPAHVTTQDHFTVTATALLVATNTPINDFAVIHTKQVPYRSYVIAAPIPKGCVNPGLYWDTHDSYHYIRVDDAAMDKDYLLVGGEDHKTGQNKHPEQAFDRLEKWTKKHFPMVQSIAYRWSGQVMEPVDGLAYIGRNPMDSDNVYIITGDSGNGMTHCTLGAMLISDLIMGRENAWEKLYSPSRISLRSAPQYIKDNINTISQYRSWFASSETSSVDGIECGEGAVIRDGLSQTAVYRAEDGGLHRCSAVCPHMGAIVAWNRVEKTWDCPCHGSRFDAQGHVINGPAITNLAEVNAAPAEPLDCISATH